MTEEQTTQLLMFLGKFWNNLVIDDETIDAWHIILVDEPYDRTLVAARNLVKASISPWPPTPGMLLAEKLRLEPPASSGVNEAWAYFTSPTSRKVLPPPSEHALKVWDIWGGNKRWGGLPDLKWSANPTEAAKVIGFARKEFEELFKTHVSPPSPSSAALTQSTRVVSLIEGLTKKVGGNNG